MARLMGASGEKLICGEFLMEFLSPDYAFIST
jgi:hypothetical protein